MINIKKVLVCVVLIRSVFSEQVLTDISLINQFSDNLFLEK